MTILSAELKFYKSATVSDTGSNGGRMSANAIASGAVANVFQAVGESERTAGSTKHRKIFCKNENTDGDALQFPKIYLDIFTPGDDRITFFAPASNGQTSTQASIVGSEKKYGCGKLDQNVIATATSLAVEVEDGATHTFAEGDKIRITDKADIDDLSGNEEYVTIDSAPSVLGDVVSFDITPALANGYSASDSRVMNVYEPADDVVATVEDLAVHSTGGTFNPANLLPNNKGGIEQNWTLTFTSANAFNIVGDTVGSVGAGSTGAGAAPNNPDFGVPYFTLQAAGFGGAFLAGDVIDFSTGPAAVPIWLKRVVPAGAAALAVNAAEIVLDGESA
jgi:hypothetical protein